MREHIDIMNQASVIILIQKDDFKSKAWSQATKRLKLGDLVPISGSPMYMPFVLAYYILGRSLPDAIVFRYLNDYPSLFRSVVRTITDLLTVFLAKIADISILWICHNIDKESSSYYPTLTHMRRSMLKRYSKKIFVMDELLVNPCINILGVPEKRIDCLCFGRTDIVDMPEVQEACSTEQIIDMVRKWKISLKKAQRAPLIGLWIGTPSGKSLYGLKILASIAKQSIKEDLSLAFLIIGPIGKWLFQRDAVVYKDLNANKKILMIDGYINIPASRWRELCGFIWKPNNDYSITLTAYNSATAGLPLVAFKGTFFGDFIIHYHLGVVIKPENPVVKELMNDLRQWKQSYSSSFLEQKTWDYGAKQLFKAVGKS